MSEKNRHSVSEQLLFRYFANEVSPDEQETVLSWKSENEENLQEFERINLLFLDLKAVNSIGKSGKAYDVNGAWQKIVQLRKIGSNETRSTRGWWKMAAAVLVLIGTGWFTYVSRQVETLELVALDAQQSVQLADGSQVSLNEGSSLTYPDKFNGDKRKVELKGEAYFEVAHNPKQPFLIQTDEVLVQVLGTTFNVNNANADSIIVTVDTGKVLMTVGANKETLLAGYTGVYYRSSQLLVKIKSERTGMHNYWRTKTLSFNGATVAQAVSAIESIYKVKVNLSNPDIANCKINVDFEDEKIEHVLEIMGETLNLVWSNQGESYLLAGYGCPQ
ncbi:FecR family protein [Reichenbachiella faecimaris]|uniref:FecR family protein n=1 Tax=Reichenbachiella faecimaris TaxID=692418 RepID=A0A1W2GJD6_REIFA|nr:FecR domain-containing protein [Reichenbachiella faecimaris]SMD36770.1 FecR family protein [Reichenbachiella faecimaris]